MTADHVRRIVGVDDCRDNDLAERDRRREKLTSIGGDYWIADDAGRRAFKVDRTSAGLRNTCVLGESERRRRVPSASGLCYETWAGPASSVYVCRKERPGMNGHLKEGAMTQDHLVIDFPIRGPANAKALAEELPPLMPDFAKLQDEFGTVHFSRFMVKGDDKLLFLSDVDGNGRTAC